MNRRSVVAPPRATGASAAGRRFAIVLALVGWCALACSGRAFALSGDLDPAFDGDGKVTLTIGPGAKADEAFALALKTDGHIVAAGSGFPATGSSRFAVARFQSTGALDGTFGGTGFVLVSFTGLGRAEAHAVALAAGAKAVLAGFAVVNSHDEFAVARVLDGGGLDPAFGSAGVLTIPFGTPARDAHANAVAMQGTKIVVAGYMLTSANRDIAIARLESDGDLDPTFGSSGTGKLNLDVGGSHDEIEAIVIDDQDRIVAAGYAVDGIQKNFLLARFLMDGTLDPSFNGTGTLAIDFDALDDDARAITLLDDGSILAAGTATIDGVTRFAAVRVDEDGILDPSFGEGGKLTTAVGSKAQGNAVAISADGRFAIAGTATNSGKDDFAVVLYRADGSPAPTFGTGGIVTFPFGNRAELASAAAFQADGNLVVAGTAKTGSNADFGLARLLVDACGNGILDPGEGCDTPELGGASCCTLECQVATNGTVCRAAEGLCDLQELCDGNGTSCPPDALVGMGAVCRATAGVCDIAEMCSGSAKACPIDQRLGAGTLCRASAGGCDPAETCDGSAVACPADQLRPVGFVCRSAADACDVSEMCSGSSAACPADAIASAGAVCRPLAGDCDIADVCDGATIVCPVDQVKLADTLCRTSAGICDVAESCNGSSPACPPDGRETAGTVCRSAAGDCDVAETCDGVATTCPTNHFLANGAVCRAAADACDVAEKCSGASAACPSDAIATAGAVCRPAVSGCDAAETCDGIAITCPEDHVSPIATVCREVAGACDVAEVCDGISADCPGDALLDVGTECRATAGDCDVAEQCDGFGPGCPSDVFQPEDTVCRAAVDDCDIGEKCGGTSAACPNDKHRRDRDHDGICDRRDVCPREPDPDQVDADGDGIGDLCDPCTSLRTLDAALLEIADYVTPIGDDTFKLKGELAFTMTPTLAPATTGMRLLIHDGDGKALFDVTVPPGERPVDSRIGWRSNETKGVYAFNTTIPVGGLVRKAKISLPATRPGVVKVLVTGRLGAFATLPVALPLTATVVLDPTPEVVELCGGVAFTGPTPAPACSFDETMSRLTCQ